MGYCGGNVVSGLPVYFFGIATFLNITKWISFVFRIQYGADGSFEQYKREMKIIYASLATFITIITLVYIYLYVRVCGYGLS